MDARWRAFLAVDLDADLRAGVAAVQRRFRTVVTGAGGGDVRLSWVKPEALHLTFAFFEALDPAVVIPLHAAVLRSIGSLTPLEVPLTDTGAFPNNVEPRVLWIGPAEAWHQTHDGRALASLHGTLRAACRSVGLSLDDKPFRPHLTLARVRHGWRDVGRALAGARDVRGPLRLPPLRVSVFTLFRSDATSAGHVHSEIWRAPLGAA